MLFERLRDEASHFSSIIPSFHYQERTDENY
jgi:hypothetical protein